MNELRIIAHNIRSLHNVGAIFRNADAFDVSKVYLTGYTGTPPRKEINKVALGSEHRVSWEQFDDPKTVVKERKKAGDRILSLENSEGAVPIEEWCKTNEDKDLNVTLILGHEVEGVEDRLMDLSDEQIEIILPGTKKSLNVSVATGIALFAFRVDW